MDDRSTIYPVETAAGLVLSVADELKGSDLYSWKIVPLKSEVRKKPLSMIDTATQRFLASNVK